MTNRHPYYKSTPIPKLFGKLQIIVRARLIGYRWSVIETAGGQPLQRGRRLRFSDALADAEQFAMRR